MTYAEMIATLSNLNNTQSIPLSALPHCSNLLHQLNKGDPSKENVYNQIVNLYIPMRQVLFCENDIAEYVTSVTEKTNEYMDMLKTLPKSLFPHQADFLSSIVPEMLCVLFWHIISGKDVELEVSAQKDLTIECTFDTSNGGTIRFKNKRVDVAVVKPCHLLFNSTNTELPIPLMAIECKTNLDKNMISGIEHSVNELKRPSRIANILLYLNCPTLMQRNLIMPLLELTKFIYFGSKNAALYETTHYKENR